MVYHGDAHSILESDRPRIGVDACRLVPLPRIGDHRGCIGVVEAREHVPFDIKRIYYLYEVPAGSARGGHGHKALEQLYIAAAGAVNVTLDDGRTRRTFRLDRPDQGLYIAPMVWRDLTNFETGTVFVVVASDHYDEADYYRDYDSFLAAARRR